MPYRKFTYYLFSLVFLHFSSLVSAQMITGHWKGRINRQKVEVKIIQNGDELTGTSYYYESPTHFRKYSIKGYFDPHTNSAVWWDDQLLEESSGKFSLGSPGKVPMLSRADFNCPGEGRMILEGKTAKKEDENDIKGDVRLDKTGNPEFHDEWDYVIDNYLVGGNDPELIEEIEKGIMPVKEEEIITENKPVTVERQPVKTKPPPPQKQPVVKKEEPVISAPAKPLTITEKFITREKKLVKEIPLEGDSIELRFYDNAEIDGDSISLFLNDQLFREHIRLTGNAYTIKIAVTDLGGEKNELIMVAENLGSIPPNTSYMVAIVNEKRYDAYLASTEGSSAMIRFIRVKN